jgi:hypothetical protein
LLGGEEPRFFLNFEIAQGRIGITDITVCVVVLINLRKSVLSTLQLRREMLVSARSVFFFHARLAFSHGFVLVVSVLGLHYHGTQTLLYIDHLPTMVRLTKSHHIDFCGSQVSDSFSWPSITLLFQNETYWASYQSSGPDRDSARSGHNTFPIQGLPILMKMHENVIKDTDNFLTVGGASCK